MRIGVPKEIKNNEFRVAMTPAMAFELTQSGHEVFIQSQAGVGAGFTNEEYRALGAKILGSAEEIFNHANLILKVKEPQNAERILLNEHHTLFTYLHLAPDPEQTKELISSKATCIAYETVTDNFNKLPLLTPMSEIAGRMSIQAGAHCLEKSKDGRGVLLSGGPGVAPANVLVLGGGVVGKNAAKIAIGMGANVTILDKSIATLRALEDQYEGKITTLFSNRETIVQHLPSSDLIIGAVLIPGAEAPKLIQKSDLSSMMPGSVIVDVAIDQGGCFETSHPTTHEAPCYSVENIIHYCVANMPGAVSRTSTMALTNATLPYVLNIANKGVLQAAKDDPGLANGLNIVKGNLCNQAVASAQNINAIALDTAIALL